KKDDSRHSSVVLLVINGGDHCSDLGSSCFTNPASCTDNMKQVQQTTLENMKRWINPVEYVPDRIEITDVGKRPLDDISPASKSATQVIPSNPTRGNRKDDEI
ncbi:hypothetical protein PFISCL1PPCAC_12873, partial [Pristionchus fissidentatus]